MTSITGFCPYVRRQDKRRRHITRFDARGKQLRTKAIETRRIAIKLATALPGSTELDRLMESLMDTAKRRSRRADACDFVYLALRFWQPLANV